MLYAMFCFIVCIQEARKSHEFATYNNAQHLKDKELKIESSQWHLSNKSANGLEGLCGILAVYSEMYSFENY